MTVRCEACGTENRDKAMFCRGCAGKLPAFVATRRPSADAAAIAAADGPDASTSTRTRPSTRSARALPGPSRSRITILAGLMVALGMSVAGVAWLATDTAPPPNPSIKESSVPAGRLPAEASLSKGESLDDGPVPNDPVRPSGGPSSGSGRASPLADDPSSLEAPDTSAVAEPSSTTPVPGVDPSAPSRNGVKRPATAAQGGGRASDPRIGCEHLFFAFAARCEANHCQLSSYARHPRCDVVREQRRKDEARRDSMPTS